MKDKYHTEVDPDDILITTGSQQCLILQANCSLTPAMLFCAKARPTSAH